MSIASTIPCIKIKISPPPSPKFCSPKPNFTVRSSNAEGPLRRPAAPSLSPPPVSSAPSLSPPPSLSHSPPAKQVAEVKGVVTLEFQRKMAKELQEYFRQKKLEEADQGPFFGFLGKNEITNGRWAMFGFAVGLLTEYATGSDLVQQLKILLSNFGVVDLD
ncbi:light-harvesting complex-like protein OHP2, chloroplastic [Phalaenopsis equestris]|uniref:light-harvesting complex-like protein OHP2, chloroplastic n=1 Tax=Phalaenopsis equestris TaxID=78828 RepID=UPI0009E2BD0E|nr:light-harvesting complex-like protein OHP2, chloroplastic [Phalaenopsis equestris]